MALPSPAPIEFFKGKRVVVTGATGLIGSYVVKLLAESGAYISAWMHTRKDATLVDSLRVGPPDAYFTLSKRHVDLLDYRSVTFRDTDVVLSCAGLTGGVGLTTVDPISYVTLATTIALNTLHAAQAAGVPLFGFLSSTTVYPPRDWPVDEDYSGFCVRPQDGPLSEPELSDREVLDTEPYPLYAGIGYSKRFLEQTCAYVSDRTKTKCAIVRPSGAYGRYDNFSEATSHVVPGMIQRALKLEPGQPFTIWGDGEDVRDIVHAEDVAYGLLLATAATGEGKVAPADPFNIASGRPVTTRELAGAILSVAGKPETPIATDPSKPTALKTRRVSILKAQKELGYEPLVDLDVGLHDTVNWFKEQK